MEDGTTPFLSQRVTLSPQTLDHEPIRLQEADLQRLMTHYFAQVSSKKQKAMVLDITDDLLDMYFEDMAESQQTTLIEQFRR